MDLKAQSTFGLLKIFLSVKFALHLFNDGALSLKLVPNVQPACATDLIDRDAENGLESSRGARCLAVISEHRFGELQVPVDEESLF